MNEPLGRRSLPTEPNFKREVREGYKIAQIKKRKESAGTKAGNFIAFTTMNAFQDGTINSLKKSFQGFLKSTTYFATPDYPVCNSKEAQADWVKKECVFFRTGKTELFIYVF
jgi:hypothetical protein